MRAVIRIFQSQKLVDQFVRFRDGEHLVALYSGFAGGCGDSVGYQFRGLSPALCFQAVQNLYEQFLNRDAVQIGRNSAELYSLPPKEEISKPNCSNISICSFKSSAS